MHNAISNIQHKLKTSNNNLFMLVDGNYFKPYFSIDIITKQSMPIKYITVEKGDNTYSSIAAASILAKVARDRYIMKLCEENPELIEKYSINSNKGYGSKKHLEGIEKYGITKWHRRSFGICRNYV